MSQLQLSLLGAPIVKHGERTLTFSTRKALALLVYLAVEGGTHPRKTLSEAFWPELDAEHGQATRLARGPFLASFTLRDSQFFDDWTRQHREYWHLRVHQLFDALSKLYERAGDRERAIETVSRWLSFDPLNEEGYRRLMRLRFSQGDRVGALRAYANGRAVLADELQVEPEPETVALAKRIRHAAPVRPAQPRSLLSPHASAGQPPVNLLDGPLLGRG